MSPIKQRGWVLMTVMIFVLVISGFLLISIENNLFQGKIESYSRDSMIVFDAAEAALLQEEAKIQHRLLVSPFYNVNVTRKVQILSVDDCGKKTYQIKVSAQYHQASVNLESIYDYLEAAATPNCLAEKISQRIFWKQVVFH